MTIAIMALGSVIGYLLVATVYISIILTHQQDNNHKENKSEL